MKDQKFVEIKLRKMKTEIFERKNWSFFNNEGAYKNAVAIIRSRSRQKLCWQIPKWSPVGTRLMTVDCIDHVDVISHEKVPLFQM